MPPTVTPLVTFYVNPEGLSRAFYREFLAAVAQDPHPKIVIQTRYGWNPPLQKAVTRPGERQLWTLKILAACRAV